MRDKKLEMEMEKSISCWNVTFMPFYSDSQFDIEGDAALMLFQSKKIVQL